MNRVLSSLLLFSTILFSLIANAGAQTSDKLVVERTPKDIMINTQMQINLVLIGDIWSEHDKAEITKRLLPSYTPMILSKGVPAGVGYNYTYIFSSEPDDVADRLFKFIDSIGVKTSVPGPIFNWMYSQQPQLVKEKILYKLIDAFRVEDWLASLDQQEGYTIYFFKPSEQQLGYVHTYGAITTDPDTNKTFVREGMMGYGGKHRLYFIDLSAGPWVYPFIPISETEAISEFHKNIHDLQTDEDFYDLIAHYVNDAVMQLFTPSYLYTPVYRLNYRMEVLLIDMTSGRTFRDVASDYIKKAAIEQAFAKLIPYAQWTSDIKGQSFEVLPRDLQRAILKSLFFQGPADNPTILVKSSEFITELEKWTQTTSTKEELSSQQEEAKKTVVVPIVLFVFDTDAYVDRVGVVGVAAPEPQDKTSPCCAIVAVGKHALFDFGAGLSTLAIHEMGHVIGLAHPHDGYNNTAGELFTDWFFDWSYSPLSYASPTVFGCGLPDNRCGLVVSEFGRFNIDAIDRGLVLSLLDQVQHNLYNSVSQLKEKGYDEYNSPPEIRSRISEIDYDVQKSKDLFMKMNYFNFTAFVNSTNTSDLANDAFDFALKAFSNSQSLLQESNDLPKSKSTGYRVDTLDVSEPSFTTEKGGKSDVYKISQPISMNSTIHSNADQKVNFTLMIQIKDSEGFTIFLGEQTFSALPEERVAISSPLPRIFERAGEYTIEIFLWTGVDNPVPLSPVRNAFLHLVS